MNKHKEQQIKIKERTQNMGLPKLNDLRDFGDIRQMREDAKLTQRNVATYCGVSLQTFRTWEYGVTKNIKPEHYEKLTEILKGT